MKAREMPLTCPPSYEYETQGPWFICHVDHKGRTQAWIMHTFDSAILRFWLANKTPLRRVLVDALGYTVAATLSLSDDDARMSGTRQAMDATLKMVADKAPVEDQTQILTMVEGIRSLDGQAL